MKQLNPPPSANTPIESPEWRYWFLLLYNQLTTDSDVLKFLKLALGTLTVDASYPKQEFKKVNSVSADYAMAGNEQVLLVDATSGNRSITLPAARIGTGTWSFPVTIRRIDGSGNTVTVNAASGDKVDTAASVTIAANKSRIFESDSATNWYTVGVN